jgi:hypothetical protein
MRKRKYGSIWRICASLNNHRSDIDSASSMPPLNQPPTADASDLIGSEHKSSDAHIALFHHSQVKPALTQRRIHGS